MFPTCGTEGNEGLDMFPNKCQLILGQRQPSHDVLDEIVRCYCCQVPLQLPQDHQFPFLERASRKGMAEKQLSDTKYTPHFSCSSALLLFSQLRLSQKCVNVTYSGEHLEVKCYCY